MNPHTLFAEEIIHLGTRQALHRHHPDRPGGTHEDAVAVQAASAWLRSLLQAGPSTMTFEPVTCLRRTTRAVLLRFEHAPTPMTRWVPRLHLDVYGHDPDMTQPGQRGQVTLPIAVAQTYGLLH